MNNTYTLYRCSSCSLIFTSPQPSLKSAKDINDEIYNSTEEQESRLAIYDKEYQRAKLHILELQKFKTSGKFLDVGCSYGIGVKAAQDAGYDAYGIEPTKHAAIYAKKHLHERIIQSTLEKAKLRSDSFDIVTLYDVLEHIPNIKGFLKEIHRILKPGGLLAVQSPNIESFAARTLKTNWNWLLVPNHLWHFSSQSLSNVLKNSGFSVVLTTTEDNIYDFASNLKSNIHFPLLSSGVVFKGLRQILYICTYGFIALGTVMWHRIGKGGSLRIYSQKTE